MVHVGGEVVGKYEEEEAARKRLARKRLADVSGTNVGSLDNFMLERE